MYLIRILKDIGMDEFDYDRDASIAYAKQDEIELAAKWCKSVEYHKLDFLNHVRALLNAEEDQLRLAGYPLAYKTKAVKPLPVLTLLSPKQALRMLECYKRALMNDPEFWKARGLEEMAIIERRRELAEFVARTKEEINHGTGSR